MSSFMIYQYAVAADSFKARDTLTNPNNYFTVNMSSKILLEFDNATP